MNGSGTSQVRVSIGMPVYNGATYIRRALDSLLAQAFSDFELIISDNASTDATRSICEEYEKKDSRIRYIRQESNLGPIGNFDFVLNQSEGKYFMWAAHDDAWDSQFLDVLVKEFERSAQDVVAIGCEAQYTVAMEKQPFFCEGSAFYSAMFKSDVDRVSHMLNHAYGNLFYSLYRRDVLFLNGVSILSVIPRVSLNEIPLFILVSFQGNWRVISDILFYKETTIPTYVQARWEMQGGLLPFGGIRHFFAGIFYGIKYHCLTAVDIFMVINKLTISPFSRAMLQSHSLIALIGHFMSCLLHYKRKKISADTGRDNG